jgi:hypothetical protein
VLDDLEVIVSGCLGRSAGEDGRRCTRRLRGESQYSGALFWTKDAGEPMLVREMMRF